MVATLRWLYAASAVLAHGLRQVQVPQPESKSALETWAESASGRSTLKTWVESASSKAAKLGDRRSVILTFSNHDYLPTLANWMAGLRKLGVDNYEVICMDKRMVAFMKSIGRPCLSHRNVQRTPQIWEFRLKMLAKLLDKGVDVVLSDADAFWLRDPAALLTEGGDIVASRGKFPFNVADQLGAAACMGWISFRGTPSVARFLRKEVMSRFAGDDQVALNYALVANGLTFPSRLAYESSTDVAEGNAGSLSVTLLDHQRFQRRCTGNFNGTYVAHCLSNKTGQSKKVMAEKFGLWTLRDDWEQVPRNGNFSEWIDKVSSSG